ncbi:MAG: ligase-associated DNA damage response endonuclease PdeM [Nitratireductor sp.]
MNQAAASALDTERNHECILEFAGVQLVADPAGCLYWPQERLLVFSDLHLEKGSSQAIRGRMIPPYDTGATLKMVRDCIFRWQPSSVISLGDSFHDGGGEGRLPDTFRRLLTECMTGRDWVWISGNHDPVLPAALGGIAADVLALGPLTFRHEPLLQSGSGEISGHLHPQARIVRRGKSVRRRCFATDGSRLIMPAFGAYTGGLNIRDKAFGGLFDLSRLHAHVMGRERIYTIDSRQLV